METCVSQGGALPLLLKVEGLGAPGREGVPPQLGLGLGAGQGGEELLLQVGFNLLLLVSHSFLFPTVSCFPQFPVLAV